MGCLSAPPPDLTYDRVDTALEVYRVFCRRVAKAEYPDDLSGERFYEVCDSGDPEDESDKPALRNILKYREEILPPLRRAFAEEEDPSPGVDEFAEGELTGFLGALVPLYDAPRETIPTATRGIATLIDQLTNEEDPRAKKVLDTVARLVKRLGYRPPDKNLGAVRALLTYPKLDDLSSKLLPVVTGDGAARAQFTALFNAAALELADEPVPVADRADSTLRHAIEFALTEDETLSVGVGKTLVLQRDDDGEADGDAAAGTPFPVPGRDDDAKSRNSDGVATSGGEPAYKTIDASQTMLAALMHETSQLIGRGERERSPLESFAHGVKPQLGPWGDRTFTIGKNNYAFKGPDIDKSALMQLAHAGATLLKYPETIPLLQALDLVITKHENEATALDFAALAIADLSKDKQYDKAKLNGPHELWDDLIDVGMRLNKRKGLFEALIRSFVDDKSGAQGKLFATWMRYKDNVSYPNAPSEKADDINKPVAGEFMEEVDRSSPDVGMNRSVWQRTMSLINALNDVKVCNKDKAVLKVQTMGLGELTFPFGDVAGDGYKECALIEIQNAVEVYSRALIGKAQVNIKDDFASVLSVLGKALGISGSVDEIQESESGLKGFTSKPSPASLARFIFAPRNEWLTQLFVPQQSREGVAIADYEPNALFPLEVIDSKTPIGGKASNFIEMSVPLVTAFDDHELRDLPDPVTGIAKLQDGYAFGHLLSVLHKHWPQRKTAPCPEEPEEGNEGCTQSLDRNAKFYSPQTGLVSYEPLLADSFDDNDFIQVLHQATKALADVKVKSAAGADIDGITALGDFVTRMLTVDASLKKWGGATTTATNLCVAQGTECKDGIGHVVTELTPIHVVADALKAMDDAFKAEPDNDRIDAWHQGRSDILDVILAVNRSGSAGSYSYQLKDRVAFAIVHPAIDWLVRRIQAHQQANDLEAWATGLSDRLAKVLKHPLAAGIVDLLDAFWPEIEASGEFTEVVRFMTDNDNNEEYFTGFLTAIADSMILIDRDPDLSPAIQFAALGLAPNAFQAIDGVEPPKGEESAAYAALELTGGVVEVLNDPMKNKFKKEDEPTALSKLLNNVVLSASGERSALEVLIDVVADVNRTNQDASTLDPLTAEEDRDMYKAVRKFLRDENPEARSLERLYSVIQHRKVKP